MLTYQISGILAASLMQTLLVLAARRISAKDWPFYYLFLIVGFGAILSLQAMWPLQWLNAVVFIGLIALAKDVRKAKVSEIFSLKKWHWAEIAALVFLLIDALYAALPLYRKDQWDYSLALSKRIFASGPLQPPIYYDNFFFCGGYEFFIGLFRYVWADDFFNHSAVDVFGWSSFILLSIGFLQWARTELKWQTPSVLILSLLFFAAIQDRESITNAKPDHLLVFFSLGSLLICQRLMESNDKRLWFLLGACLVMPLAIKITWVQFIPVLLAIIFYLKLIRKIKLNWVSFLKGIALAFITVLPLLYKSWHFFGNPLHPVRLWIFRSTRWIPELETYWDTYTGRAVIVGDFPQIYLENLWKLPLRALWFFLPVLLLVVIRKYRLVKTQWTLATIGFVITFLLWPKFFGPDIAARYAFPAYGLILFVTVALMRNLDRKPLVFAALFVPIFLRGGYDVSLARLAKYNFLSIEDAYSEKSGATQHALLLLAVNDLRKKEFPNASYSEKITLLDRASGYFLNSDRIYFTHVDTAIEFAEHKKSGGKPCIEDFLLKRDVHYVVEYARPFAQWPKEYQGIQPALQDAGHASGKIKLLDHGRLQQLINDSAQCN